jgi:hypothetical protein
VEERVLLIWHKEKTMKWVSEDDMLRHEQIHALVCLGGLTEGFDYSESRVIMKYWATMRRNNGYSGGYVPFKFPTVEQAKAEVAKH